MNKDEPSTLTGGSKIEVWMNQDHVASVEFVSGKVKSWEYTAEWLANGFELSPVLDFSGKIKSEDAVGYLENLFPEGNVFDSLVEILGVSKGNQYSILRALGKETSGCLMFLAPGEKPSLISPSVRVIEPQEFERRVSKSDDIPVAVWDGSVRLSVAGLQSKINIIHTKNGGLIGLPQGSASSTHILKFEKKNQENLVLNEKLMLDTAGLLGIPVCNTEVLSVAGKRLLLVERFDRKVDESTKIKAESRTPISGVKPEEELQALDSNYSIGEIEIPSVQRTHIIDGCQALGLQSTMKYERYLGDGVDVRNHRLGVSFEDLGQLAWVARDSEKARCTILRWAIFNLAVGNFDAHGKNISFSLSRDGLDLAPFYDLVSIEALSGKFKNTFAMGYGDNFGETEFTWDDLCRLALDLRVEDDELLENAISVLQDLPDKLRQAVVALPPTTADENVFITRLREVCGNRSRALLEMIAEATDHPSLKDMAKIPPP